MDARIAVLVSGSGTNLQTLLDDPFSGPRVSLVLSDRPGVRAIERAHERGVETAVIEPSAFPDRLAFDEAVADLLEARAIDFLVSAGYMRLLGKAVVEVYAGRWLNVHPALLPSFPGTRSVADALEYGVKVTGVTVHLVDEDVDHGPIVMQETLHVFPSDDHETLEARVHEVEHRLLPAAVRAMVEGRLKLEGRVVHLLEETDV